MAKATKGPSAVNAQTYDERVAQAKTLRIGGLWQGQLWGGMGNARSAIETLNKPGATPGNFYDNITDNPKAIAACKSETGSPPDWVALGRKRADGSYIVPIVLLRTLRVPKPE